jgi:hypothetical protein
MIAAAIQHSAADAKQALNRPHISRLQGFVDVPKLAGGWGELFYGFVFVFFGLDIFGVVLLSVLACAFIVRVGGGI